MNQTWYIIYITIPKIEQEIKVGLYIEGKNHDENTVVLHALNEINCEYVNVDKLKEYHATKGLTYEITDIQG